MRLRAPLALILLSSLACMGGEESTPASEPTARTVEAEPEPSNPPARKNDRDAAWLAVGDVGPSSAVLWARAPAAGQLRFELGPEGGEQVRIGALEATATTDFAVQLDATGLEPATRHTWTVTYDDGEQKSLAHGSFSTAPEEHVAVGSGREAITFTVVGDLGGQGWCRDVEQGYAIAQHIKRRSGSFVIANGDMIYADGICPAQAPDGRAQLEGEFPSIADPAVDWTDAAATREVLDLHWRYNRADPVLKSLLAHTPVIAQWDDHEVINDFGAAWTSWETGDASRAGYSTLVAQGRQAFFDWWPIRTAPGEPGRMHRRMQWGADLDVFVADARSHRSSNAAPDGPDKTLLGTEQAQWLQHGVAQSKATFKVVSLDVPLATPTGSNPWMFGRDGVANGTGSQVPPTASSPDISASTGFEHEIAAILTAWDTANVTGLVFVTTDVHFARISRFSKDFDGDGDKLKFHEIISGPLSAWKGEPELVDASFGPTVLYEEGGLHNFAALTLAQEHGGPVLSAEIVDEDGQARDGSQVEIRP